MRWQIEQGDILDVQADVLVCSANPHLTLSGGVGGAFLLRYGDAMQQELQQYLTSQDRRTVPRGTIITTAPHGSPYRSVLHAVGVDVFYDTSAEVVQHVVGQALETVAQSGAVSVALTAIATGYGRLSLEEFCDGIRPLLNRTFVPVERCTLCVRDPYDAKRLAELLPQAKGCTP